MKLKSFELSFVGRTVGSYLTLMSCHVLRGTSQASTFVIYAEPL